MNQLPKKILLVQLFSNGDCLYATTIAHQIKIDFPKCNLTWAIAGFCKDIIKLNPYVDDMLVVDSVAKNDIIAYRKLKQELILKKNKNIYDEIFFVQPMDENQAYYTGCIRSNVLNSYPFPITVDIKPIVCLSDEEKSNAREFAETYQLKKYKHIVLFEFAPQSGQSTLTFDHSVFIAEQLTKNVDVAIIMSSANKINHPNQQIIDGSTLSIRETAALTHYCTFLLGTSSGITWLSTSTAAKQLPMIQLLNSNTVWVNPISRDFKRFGFSTEGVIELISFDSEKIIAAAQLAFENFSMAKQKFNQEVPLQFYTSRKIVYNLLCYAQFKAIMRHILYNKKIYGNNMGFYQQVALGFLDFPFKLVKNVLSKKILPVFKK